MTQKAYIILCLILLVEMAAGAAFYVVGAPWWAFIALGAFIGVTALLLISGYISDKEDERDSAIF